MSLRTIGQSVSVIALLFCAAAGLAQDKPAKPDGAKPAAAKPEAAKGTQAAFEKMKSLVGEWVSVHQPEEAAGGDMRAADAHPAKPADNAKGGDQPAKPGNAAKGAEKPAKEDPDSGAPQPIVYKLISAGSVVHETMFPGSPHEMVTVYHLDGDDLVLTHYCALGNQPRMKAEKSADANKIVFKFAGGTNLDPAKDAHMHDVTFTFIDPDHISQEWTFYNDGKATKTEKFDLMRKK